MDYMEECIRTGGGGDVKGGFLGEMSVCIKGENQIQVMNDTDDTGWMGNADETEELGNLLLRAAKVMREKDYHQ